MIVLAWSLKEGRFGSVIGCVALLSYVALVVCRFGVGDVGHCENRRFYQCVHRDLCCSAVSYCDEPHVERIESVNRQ